MSLTTAFLTLCPCIDSLLATHKINAITKNHDLEVKMAVVVAVGLATEQW
jgi:hypothetical protein